MSELAFKSTHELALLVNTGELSATEVVAYFLERIEELEPQINAFIEVDAERALAAAEKVAPGDPRPFAGVPIGVKGNAAVEGYKMNFGSKYFGEFRALHTDFKIRRLQDAGFIVLGITNMPEIGVLPTTEPRFTGATSNPWNLARTPGGSSGGSAAAVASGMLPIAHGNDGGGSIRIPAACCGLIGLKPSRGRISLGPTMGDGFLLYDGVLSRTVAETASALDLMEGYELGDSTWAPSPATSFAETTKRDPGKLRVGFSAQNALGAEVDPECLAGMHVGAALLEGIGHEVSEVNLPLPEGELMWPFVSLFASALASVIKFGESIFDRPPADGDLEPLTEEILNLAQRVSAVDYFMAQIALQSMSRNLITFLDDYDVLLTPALATRPPVTGNIGGCGEDPMADFGRSGLFTPYTATFNITGQPALTVPVKMGEDGMPTSVQLVGRPLGEDVLLQVAAQIEQQFTVGHPQVAVEAQLES